MACAILFALLWNVLCNVLFTLYCYSTVSLLQPAYCLLIIPIDILVCNKSCLRFTIMLRHGMLRGMLFMLQQYRM